MFWQEQATLLISDVHLGKVTHFRKYGAAVPKGAAKRNFELLDEALSFFDVQRICFLGDLFHSYLNKEWDLFEHWVQKTALKMVLVVGNHDLISPHKYEDLGIAVMDEMQMGGFLLTHHPEQREGFFNFSGHIHPAIKLRGRGKQSLRLPCFFKAKHQMILPAFGEFTGSHCLEKEKGDEVYAIADATVIKI